MKPAEDSCDTTLGSSIKSTSTLTSSCRQQSSVKFGSIKVREFERIVGDNPAVSDFGPPLSIGWGFHQNDDISVDEYEEQKHRDGEHQSSSKLEPLEGRVRRNILQYGFQVPKVDIEESLREVYRIQKQRNKARRRKEFPKTIKSFLKVFSKKSP